MSATSYPALARAKTLQAELTAAFGTPAVRTFAHLPLIGCCADHEAGFAWYRRHHWGEMPDAIAADELDAFEVSSLHEATYFAFVPGLCLHTLNRIAAVYERQDFAHLDLDDWILAGLLPVRPVVGTGRYLSLAQYQCVAAVLFFYDDCLSEIQGHSETVEAAGGRVPLRTLIEQRWGNDGLFQRDRAP
jgi:hypothetical protein